MSTPEEDALYDEIHDLRAQLEACQRKSEERKAALWVLLDQIDFTAGACTITEMIGALIDRRTLNSAKKALEDA